MAQYPTNNQFGGSPYNNPQMQNPWQVQSNTSNPQGMPYLQQYAQWGTQMSPQQVIQSYQPLIQEQMQGNFNQAASRIGQLGGGLRGTPYAGALGQAARGASSDLANIANQYAYNAANTQYQGGLSAAQAMQQQNMFSQSQEQQNMQDWWNRYQDWYYKGGSPENMQWWQGWGKNLYNQYTGGNQ